MMIDFFSWTLLLLFLTFIGGAVRILLGPTRYDRMMAAQLFGTTGVAMMLILSKLIAMPALIDVALLFALLAAVAVVAFVQRSTSTGTAEFPEHGGMQK